MNNNEIIIKDYTILVDHILAIKKQSQPKDKMTQYGIDNSICIKDLTNTDIVYHYTIIYQKLIEGGGLELEFIPTYSFEISDDAIKVLDEICENQESKELELITEDLSEIKSSIKKFNK